MIRYVYVCKIDIETARLRLDSLLCALVSMSGDNLDRLGCAVEYIENEYTRVRVNLPRQEVFIPAEVGKVVCKAIIGNQK